jgi:hypothetical protein
VLVAGLTTRQTAGIEQTRVPGNLELAVDQKPAASHHAFAFGYAADHREKFGGARP